MKIGVVGNRKGWNRLTIYKKLDDLNLSNNDIIVTGGANGVDTYAMDYAKENGIGLRVFYPDKSKPFPERFYIRNEQIVIFSDMVIAFNKKAKSGTTNTINLCNLHNVFVEIITSDLYNINELCKTCGTIKLKKYNDRDILFCPNKKCPKFLE